MRDLIVNLVKSGRIQHPACEMAAYVKVFGCRPFIDRCCPPRQGRRSKTSKEGNRESEGRRRRRNLWGFETCWCLLSSGRNDYQRGLVVIWLVRYPGLYAAVEAYLPFG